MCRNKSIYKTTFNKVTKQYDVISLMFGAIASYNSRKEALQHKKKIDTNSTKGLLEAINN